MMSEMIGTSRVHHNLASTAIFALSLLLLLPAALCAATVAIKPISGPHEKHGGLPGTYTEVDASSLGSINNMNDVDTISAKLHNDDAEAEAVEFTRISATKSTWYGEDTTDIVGVLKLAMSQSEEGTTRIAGIALSSDYAYKILTLYNGTTYAARISQGDFFEEAEPICR
eukprot:CAMPEP_0183781122 /NCGR_PEP_ID=MMETSP0739-20130205/57965_1 /TAXON_ID=385413 /ORGANISM="Thalassiosira miniscula, Strain CCMP1093" /LENGTH=169 /DNA_ID=CAMNT_0026024237 /DNA_START=30 /DNA_END=536 /DNA_ORIENTATION=+